VRAHEFHHSRLENLADGLDFAWTVERGQGITGQRDGVRVHNLVASYAHLRSAAGTGWASRFVEFVRACKARRIREGAAAGAALAG
jgi:cobyrinic acid a,c-diamide synthase